jgi:O-antigen/teichoic acid export membrane protein
MKIFLIILLIAALALGIIGFLIEALLWLAAIGLVLFLVTGAYWWFKFRSSRGSDVETAR